MATRNAGLLGMVVVCLTALLPHASAAQTDAGAARIDEMAREAVEIQEKIGKLLYRIPTCEGIEDEPMVRAMATQAGELTAFELASPGAGERLRLAGGQPTGIVVRRLEISGRDPFGKLFQFLVRLGLRNRLVETESLRVEAAADGTVDYTARLALPCYDEPEEEPRASGGDVFAGLLSELRETHQLLVDLTARSRAGGLVIALAALEQESEGKAVALTRVRAEREVALEGAVRGAASRDGLRAALERADFRVQDVRWAPAGSCETFSVVARVEARERSIDEIPIAGGNGLFDSQTADACQPVPSLGRIAARGAAPSADGSALTLRLREIELIDLFSVLHDVTIENFVLDPGLRGQVDVEIEGATLEETFAALRAAGVAVGPGPLRQVFRVGSRPETAAQPSARYTGELMTATLSGAGLTELLCSFTHVAPRRIVASPEVQGRVHLLARDLPWDQMLDGVATALGYVTVLDSDPVFFGPVAAAGVAGYPGAVGGCEVRGSGSAPASRLNASGGRPRPAFGDLELAGVARAGNSWKAYAYSPTRRFVTLAPGEALDDAQVISVDPSGVTLATHGAGEVRLSFP